MMTTTMMTMQRQLKGQCGVPPYTPAALLHEAQSRQLRGKTVVAVRGGIYSKRQLPAEAKELGVKMVLVDSNPKHRAKDIADIFLHLDLSDHNQDERHVQTILHLLSQQLPGCHLDGCLTWMDDAVPLTARLGQALGLQDTTPLEAALVSKSKERTHAVLRRQTGVVASPDCSLPPAVFASPVARVSAMGEVAAAVEKIPLPAVMKLEFGTCSVGVKLVRSVQEAERHLALVHAQFRTEPAFTDVSVGYDDSMILMPRLVGTEHDVDLVLFRSELVAAFVSDNGPTRLPLYMPASGLMPSALSPEKKREVIQAAVACCRGLGLHTGVINVEMIMTSQGPRLLEVNARMGGSNLRDLIRLLYSVDLFHLALLCACGIRPALPPGASDLEKGFPGDGAVEDKMSKGYFMSIMLYASRHSQALNTTASPQCLQALHQKGEIFFSHFRLQDEPSGTKFEKPVGNVAVWGPTLPEAQNRLITVCISLGLESEESVLQVVSNFC